MNREALRLRRLNTMVDRFPYPLMIAWILDTGKFGDLKRVVVNSGRDLLR